MIDKLYFQINKSKSTIGRLLITECHFFLFVSLIFFSILKEHFRIYILFKNVLLNLALFCGRRLIIKK